MVKLGFIVEGITEKIILESSDFFHYLDSLNIAYVPVVIDVKGNGNLLPDKISQYTKILSDKGATDIFILTDLDEEQCITNTKARITTQVNRFVIVSIKTIEAWFLADSEAMRRYFNDPEFYFDYPETVKKPFEEIKVIRKSKIGRGFNDKRVLANTLVHRIGFSIQRSAKHPNCPSAKYFIDKIAQIAAINSNAPA